MTAARVPVMESSAIASQPSLLDDVAHISICHRQISVPVAIDEVTVLGSTQYLHIASATAPVASAPPTGFSKLGHGHPGAGGPTLLAT